MDLGDSTVVDYLHELDSQAERIKIKVLLLGPNTDTESPGAKLRKYIATNCAGHRTAIRGERKDLIAAFKKVMGSKYFDLCSYEQSLAETVDALIIIPASAGSLVELGLFALSENIHPKTLVLFNCLYEEDDSPTFIKLGPKLSYDIRGATVMTVDYLDKEGIWNIVNDFLLKRRAIKFSKKR